MNSMAKPYPASNVFTTISLTNRLKMPVKLDVRSFQSNDQHIIVARINANHHHTMLVNNIECMAYQLKQRFADTNSHFILIEHRSKHRDEWWQWNFEWNDNELISYYNYKMSKTRVLWIKQLINGN